MKTNSKLFEFNDPFCYKYIETNIKESNFPNHHRFCYKNNNTNSTVIRIFCYHGIFKQRLFTTLSLSSNYLFPAKKYTSNEIDGDRMSKSDKTKKQSPFRETYPALMIAKGAGKCLNLTSTLLFVSMCRWVLTSIRNTPAGKFFALDVIVDIHKVLGVVYVGFAFIHTGAHVFTFLEYSKNNTVVLDDNSTKVNYNFLLTSKFC